MTAKTYMEQLSYYIEKRIQLRAERREVKIDIADRGIDYSADRVQSTPKNRMEEEGWKLLEKLDKIDKQLAKVTEEIDTRHNMILNVSRQARMKVLFERYYNNKPLHVVADEIGYSYSHCRKIHQEGLEEIGRMLQMRAESEKALKLIQKKRK